MSTISARVKNDVTEMEHLFWRARVHKPSAMIDYLDAKAIFLLPTDGGILGPSSDPKLHSKLKDEELSSFSGYEIQDEEIVEVGMMCAVVCYTVSASKTDDAGKQIGTYRAYCSSTWKQLASSKWKLCTHQESPIAG